MYKRLLSFITALVLFVPVTIYAGEEEGRIESSGDIKVGVQQIGNNNTKSSKFNEYRDIKDGFYLYKLDLEGLDTQTGRYLEFKGQDIIRDDQNIILRVGRYGIWEIEGEWHEIPHRLSNKAKTPYNYQGGGLYTVPTTAGITSITSASTTQDTSVSTYLNSYLHSTDLGTQREKGRVALTYTPTSQLRFKLEYSGERKEGTILTGAPLGDRPPRTVNTQIPEPVDYQTRDLRFDAEYVGDQYQFQFSYLLSDFENDITSLTWQNIFFGDDADAGTQGWNDDIGRTTSTYGRTALYPDNRYQNVTLSFGLNLPLESRLTATASYGWMEQDKDLLPYSYSTLESNWNSTSKLPRTKADAEIETTMFNVNYTLNPMDRLNLRAFYRYYDLDNGTKADNWYYITSDTSSNTSGGTATVNKRTNLAYSYTKQNYGLDAYYSIRRSTLGLGYEREEIERDYREADTDENIFKATINSRPVKWLSLRVKYLYGDREADSYNYKVTDASYWYTKAEYTDSKDNPLFNFSNPPDMRKYDVSDRERKQWEVSGILSPLDTVNINLSYMHREDDFDSGVSPTTVAGYNGATGVTTNYNTVGKQLGLLENEVDTYSAGVNYAPVERLNLSLNYGREENEGLQRGIGASEDDKYNGSGWKDASKLWEARIKDKTNTVGLGGGYVIIPEKLNLVADYSYSYGTVDIDYSGYGSDKTLTTYYAFNDPEKVSHRQHTLNATLEYQMFKGWIAGLGYLYDRYRIKDWMQEPSGGWVEQVGSEYYLRDTSQSTHWGNRLVSLGSYLGPSYEAHVGIVTLAYRW